MTRRRVSERLTIAWVNWYTRSAPEPVGSDRRAEVASDVFEQVNECGAGEGSRRARRALLGRLVRGLPSDVLWRLELECHADRISWHIAHPATAVGFCWFLLLPIGLLADAGHSRLPGLRPIDGWLIGAVICISAFAVVLGLVASARAITEVRPLLRVGVHQWRIRLFTTMAVFWALSGLWRFTDTVMTPVSNLAWGAFGYSLVMYLLVRTLDGLTRRRSLDFEKVSS